MSRKEKATAVAATAVAPAPAVDREFDPPPQGIELAEAEIAARAYSLWESRGGQGGTPQEDWDRAIRELTQERATSDKP